MHWCCIFTTLKYFCNSHVNGLSYCRAISGNVAWGGNLCRHNLCRANKYVLSYFWKREKFNHRRIFQLNQLSKSTEIRSSRESGRMDGSSRADNIYGSSGTSRAEAKEGECLVCATFGRIGIFLPSQDALEVMLFTYFLSYWTLAVTWLRWPWWMMIPNEDLTNVTLVSENAF